MESASFCCALIKLGGIIASTGMCDPCMHACMCMCTHEQAKKGNRFLLRYLYFALIRILHVFVLSRMTNIIIQI